MQAHARLSRARHPGDGEQIGSEPKPPGRARRRRTGVALAAVLAVALVAGACTLPAPPPYPYYGPYGSSQGVINEAQRQSAALEQYIKDWLELAGRAVRVVPQLSAATA